MKVLVACEYSGVVRDAFLAHGHDAMSCDLLPTDRPGPHYQGDVRDVLDNGWDMMIAHPPCTYLCNSGVQWLYREPRDMKKTTGIYGEARWKAMREGALFFRALLDAPISRIAVENPIMHNHARKIIGESQTQVIQPWMFGHPERKGTCLWLKNLPMLNPTNVVKEEMLLLPRQVQHRLWHTPPSKDRWKIRSTTFQGIADAMASQWGKE